MANVVVANPHRSSVTVSGHVVPPYTCSVHDLTGANVAGFLAAGCSVGPYTDSSIRERQDGGYLLHMTQSRADSLVVDEEVENPPAPPEPDPDPDPGP